MKLLVAGSRDITDALFIRQHIALHIQRRGFPENIELISGMARGVDTIAANFAQDCNLILHKFPADWDKHGRSAGYIRNKEMGECADELLAFWDGKSNGTKNMIDIMRILKKKTTIIYV